MHCDIIFYAKLLALFCTKAQEQQPLGGNYSFSIEMLVVKFWKYHLM